MSIKGDWGKLYVGKKEINIIDIIGNKTKIKYDDISKIEYEFRSATEGGYIDFYLQYGKMKRFTFSKKSNEPMQRAIDYIQEKCPNLDIIEHDSNQDPFYKKNIFIGLLTFFCFAPFGLALLWCYKKRSLADRIIFTIMVVAIYALIIYWRYMAYKNAVAEMNNALDQVQQMFHGI